ncbi:hypothetical protein NKR23_g8288 [Pleurostoma richardsiae]|uniref:N-acetyltransferase domain-containing protein n=1 Tax=Pleurostoma richardsiae TaxID=41990 RepID=A0AA38VPW1_9PEZI|nr:hypothetical protein NKR23_g8288 [Pleurostoma richardsiae]
MSGQATPYIFQPAAHSHLVPYLAALHGSCINHDRMVGAFLSPLNHERLLAWWKDKIAEVTAGTRVIFLLLDESQPGSKAKGPELMGVAMLALPHLETAPYRANVESLLVSPKYRRRGGAKMLMEYLELEAAVRAKTLLMAEAESGTAAEAAFHKFGFTEVGKVPRYAFNSAGEPRDVTFFYKDLSSL